MKLKLTKTERAFFREAGRRGGLARAKKLTKKKLSAIGKLGGRPRKPEKAQPGQHEGDQGALG